ncbi:glycoside hydrolase family protein [Sphingobacterium hotanense]|uniref:glycoside hydrolase family protein n=1 Tax=Sphingobacterium hotanense TaxID=649196 RepID=UPI0021A68A4E|nr:hypothetical protein [Sphingobacterium hotanense]MCT1524475.1 hypothetical protein [Sphingobacterium hotanense]
MGGANLSKSRLLKKFNINPSDPNIREEFAKWNKAGGKVFAGLLEEEKRKQIYISVSKRMSEVKQDMIDRKINGVVKIFGLAYKDVVALVATLSILLNIYFVYKIHNHE